MKSHSLTQKQKSDLRQMIALNVKSGLIMKRFSISRSTLWFYKNPNDRNASLQRWREKNREQNLAKMKEYYLNHREELLKYNRKYNRQRRSKKQLAKV